MSGLFDSLIWGFRKTNVPNKGYEVMRTDKKFTIPNGFELRTSEFNVLPGPRASAVEPIQYSYFIENKTRYMNVLHRSEINYSS